MIPKKSVDSLDYLIYRYCLKLQFIDLPAKMPAYPEGAPKLYWLIAQYGLVAPAVILLSLVLGVTRFTRVGFMGLWGESPFIFFPLIYISSIALLVTLLALLPFLFSLGKCKPRLSTLVVIFVGAIAWLALALIFPSSLNTFGSMLYILLVSFMALPIALGIILDVRARRPKL